MQTIGADAAVRKCITVDEAAQWLGISRPCAYAAVKRGEIPTIKIGRRLLVPVASFDRMLGVTTTSAEAA